MKVYKRGEIEKFEKKVKKNRELRSFFVPSEEELEEDVFPVWEEGQIEEVVKHGPHAVMFTMNHFEDEQLFQKSVFDVCKEKSASTRISFDRAKSFSRAKYITLLANMLCGVKCLVKDIEKCTEEAEVRVLPSEKGRGQRRKKRNTPEDEEQEEDQEGKMSDEDKNKESKKKKSGDKSLGAMVIDDSDDEGEEAVVKNAKITLAALNEKLLRDKFTEDFDKRCPQVHMLKGELDKKIKEFDSRKKRYMELREAYLDAEIWAFEGGGKKAEEYRETAKKNMAEFVTRMVYGQEIANELAGGDMPGFMEEYNSQIKEAAKAIETRRKIEGKASGRKKQKYKGRPNGNSNNFSNNGGGANACPHCNRRKPNHSAIDCFMNPNGPKYNPNYRPRNFQGQ